MERPGTLEAERSTAEAAPDQPVRHPWGRVIGLPVTVGDLRSITDTILRLARGPRSAYVCVANVHMLTTAHADPDFRRVVEQAALVVSDGMPLVWLLRRQGYPEAQQVRGPDLMIELCRAPGAEACPVYLYGGDPGLMADLVRALERRCPGAIVAGAEPAPLLPDRPPLDAALLARIRGSGARIVLVALGCPKQEFWMRAHSPHLDAVLVGVGQAFAINAGRLPEAPLWLRRHGLEWLFRLVREPRRLWRRYLVNNSMFLTLVAREALRARLGRAPR